MTNDQTPKESELSESMSEADTANGEAPEPDTAATTEHDDAATRTGPDGKVAHPTGTEQAKENQENDPPA